MVVEMLARIMWVIGGVTGVTISSAYLQEIFRSWWLPCCLSKCAVATMCYLDKWCNVLCMEQVLILNSQPNMHYFWAFNIGYNRVMTPLRWNRLLLLVPLRFRLVLLRTLLSLYRFKCLSWIAVEPTMSISVQWRYLWSHLECLGSSFWWSIETEETWFTQSCFVWIVSVDCLNGLGDDLFVLLRCKVGFGWCRGKVRTVNFHTSLTALFILCLLGLVEVLVGVVLPSRWKVNV